MSQVIVDASVTGALCLPDEDADFARRVFALAKDDGVIVPVIWPIEVSNILASAVRRSRITEGEAEEATHLLLQLPIFVSQTTKEYGLLTTREVALSHGLTSYDASYLDLAHRRNLPLATLDRKLRQAANDAGVTLIR